MMMAMMKKQRIDESQMGKYDMYLCNDLCVERFFVLTSNFLSGRSTLYKRVNKYRYTDLNSEADIEN